MPASFPSTAHLLDSEGLRRRDRDRAYMMSLTNENLLRAHYLEAGLIRMDGKPSSPIHWGWDSPTSQIRGTFCGHWLSAAAHMITDTGDAEMLAKANFLVSEIARCQEANGGRWAFPIPEKYLYWLKAGRHPWAPQYVCHKNMMGLLDMYTLTGSRQALDTVLKCAEWFYDFTSDISCEQMSEMMDLEETGGMLELWADLYGITHDEKHLELLRRYERPRFADALLAGEDVLCNMHANSTVPEAIGYARAYEVTGEERYRKVAEAYWKCAVTDRGMYATGGQTSGEVWTPMGELRARLGNKTQEHCVVYNMMRLAEYLFRWTGDAVYQDYRERNLWNGIFAQGFWKDEMAPQIGGDPDQPATTVAYYLPLKQGSRKFWGSPLEHFWCCHGTLIQANAIHHEHIFYQNGDSLIIAQYIPSALSTLFHGADVSLKLTQNPQAGHEMMRLNPANHEIQSRPHSDAYTLEIQTAAPAVFDVAFRVPAWSVSFTIKVNGEPVPVTTDERSFAHLRRKWHQDKVSIVIGKRLSCCALPDDPDMVAFMDGPICLAGLVPEEHILYGDKEHPENSVLCGSDERQWQEWRTSWKTCHQPFGIEFMPLYQIGNEQYTVYFPVQASSPSM